MVEPNVAVDAVLGSGLAQVGQDLVGRGDGMLVAPGLELVAEGVQIGVRPDPGIPEQVPGAAGDAAGLQDRVTALGVLALQIVGGADARDAGTDDQHVDVVRITHRTMVPPALTTAKVRNHHFCVVLVHYAPSGLR